MATLIDDIIITKIVSNNDSLQPNKSNPFKISAQQQTKVNIGLTKLTLHSLCFSFQF